MPGIDSGGGKGDAKERREESSGRRLLGRCQKIGTGLLFATVGAGSVLPSLELGEGLGVEGRGKTGACGNQVVGGARPDEKGGEPPAWSTS